MAPPTGRPAAALDGRVLLRYARYLGIDPETEPRLVHIAHDALTDPLPGWECHIDENYGRPFWCVRRAAQPRGAHSHAW